MRTFRLTRFFSVTSLIGIVMVMAGLVALYRELTVRNLVEHEGRAHADLTRAFANAVWNRHRAFVLQEAPRTRAQWLADPAFARLRADVMGTMAGLQVAKIKVYNRAGQTVFSTDERQVGEDKRANAGFQRALAGEVTSQITFRERFDAFEGVLNNRNLIASYVPIRPDPGAPPEGVFEVYSDVTELLARQSHAQWQVAAEVLGLLALLYVFLHGVVRKADRIIAAQERERAEREAEVRHQAYHDALTGLPNRAHFAERLDEVISLARRHTRVCGLMFIDLDRFKIVNDSLGHEAGDRLLREVSTRLSRCMRDSDLLFRMGGDEFTVILPEVAAPEDAAAIARRVLEAVARPILIDGHELVVGATVGISIYPGDGDDAETLLKNADAAMYSAKDAGRGNYAFYRAAMNQRALQRLNLESALQKAFRDGEFTLHYQPRLDTATRSVVGMEALMRWQPPGRPMVMPGEFIGVLEETGMMVQVGEWVLRSACQQLARWRKQGLDPLRMSVNVSPVQFESPAFVPMVRRVLADTGVPAAMVELEITESMLIRRADAARETVQALREAGVRVAIDDFGTGYSSLNYLRKLPVDYLKIDRTFVTDVATSARDRAMAKAIVELAHALGIVVVAEGVETEPQAEFFSSIGCGELQGYLFSRPAPPDQAARLAHDPTVTA